MPQAYIRLYIMEGKVQLDAWVNFLQPISQSLPDLTINDGSWYTIQVTISGKIALKVGNKTNTSSDSGHTPIEQPFDVHIGSFSRYIYCSPGTN